MTKQIQDKFSPRCEGIHCMNHHTNLVLQTLFHLLVVSHIKLLLQFMYVFFFHSHKRDMEFTKLAKRMGNKGNKILKNIKI